MLQAIATDTVEEFDEQRATALMAEKNNLEQQLAQYGNVQQEQEYTQSRLDEIFTILEGLENHPMEYDDRPVREDWKLNKQYQFDVRVRIRTLIWRKYLFSRAFTSCGYNKVFAKKSPGTPGLFFVWKIWP